MRQRLFKAISFVALMVSVFFLSSVSAYAQESDDVPVDWDGYFNVYGMDYMVLDFATQNSLPNSTAYSATFKGSSITSVYAYGMEQGSSYNGLAYIDVAWTREYSDSTASYRRVNLYVTDVQAPDGVTVSFRMKEPETDWGESFKLRIYIYFDNYFHTPAEDYLHFSFVANIEQSVVTTSGGALIPYYFTRNPGDFDWAGTVISKKISADPNISDVYYVGQEQMQQQSQISQQEMQQQQQIADQQAQQSAQQHEDLKNGFQDDTYNSNVSNAGSSIDSYVSIESDLMNDKNQQVVNYADQAFKLDSVQPYANAILACSTFYTAIWNSFGEFNIVFVVILALGVAGLVLGLTRRK